MSESIVRAYRTELRPTPIQKRTLGRWCGAARWVYNWALEERIRAYEERGETLTAYGQDKALTALKREDEYAWLNEIPRRVLYYALQDLDAAYKRFFERVKAGTGKPGFPRFKARRPGQGSCSVYGTDIAVEERRIRLPRLGWVRLKERGYIPCGVKYGRVTISEHGGRWYISVVAHVPAPDHVQTDASVVAAHHGVRTWMLAQVGESMASWQSAEDRIRPLRRRLKRLQRRLARQQKGSNRREKTRRHIAQVHARIANIRREETHRLTHALVCELAPEVLVMQEYQVREMLEQEIRAHGRRLPRRIERRIREQIASANMGEILRQVRYKAGWYGVDLYEVPSEVPTSKRCSACGHVREHFGAEIVYECLVCGAKLDREVNAVRNLMWIFEQSALIEAE
ncbi:MAG: transposase [Anaerolineae bacterium]|nr:MAG: transposase [Anaerolineae bacterium]